MKLYEIKEAIDRVAPIEGINSDGVIWFTKEATEKQKADAKVLMDQYLPELET